MIVDEKNKIKPTNQNLKYLHLQYDCIITAAKCQGDFDGS